MIQEHHSLPPSEEPVSWLKAVTTVLSAFVGIRHSESHLAVAKQLRPVHYIVSGLFLMACLILTLIVIVRLVIGMAVHD